MSSATRAETPQTHFQAPGFYRMMLGKDEITVLSDGTAPRSVDEIMSKPEVVRRALAAAHEDLPLQLSINSFLINKAGRLILVDTGAGELFGAHSGGLLLANLRAAGYGAERIDAVLLTHIHGDHSGGLSIGGKRLFPNATVYVDRRDVDFWLGADAEKAHPSLVRTIRQSHATLDPYVAAGRLHPFDGAGEPLPGIRAIPAHGHTPGHTAYLIESEGRKLLLWGDTIHLAEAQFDDPSISIEYDVNREEAVASRRALLAEAADQGYLVGAAHISFPGLGHVRRDAGGYGWAPAPYDAGQ
ncbi:MBL fold metallo-hydrolase [Telmatospirillum siberiense]|uniref:MBL fold metallo-hydrolase n=2 Tax=Telmatospirillum siberiense TaxID=382514 RepID=A0A2N3PP24_9PROT|nr:MBL fold metallo-hydrolase [Telmatospirillum siberiense]